MPAQVYFDVQQVQQLPRVRAVRWVSSRWGAWDPPKGGVVPRLPGRAKQNYGREHLLQMVNSA